MITCPYCSMQNEDGTLFCERCKSDLLNIPEQSPMSSSVQEGIETLQANEVPMAEPVISDTAPHAPFSGSTVEHKPMEDTAVSQMVATTPKLVVIRGQRINAEYPIYTGDNFVGRTDEKPVDIDLEDQEASDRIWCSRQHAKIVSDQAGLSIEDLGSQNGTFVNRARIYPGQVRPLANGDVVQIGTVQLRVKT